MSNKKNPFDMKEILVSALVLAVIAGGVTAALAGTNALTEHSIYLMNEKAEIAARQQVIDADQFVKKSITDDEQEIIYYTAKKNGETVGYVFTASTVGKSSGLVVMTGISVDGKITGVTVTDDNETAGYVELVKSSGLFSSFADKQANAPFTLGKDIDVVSHATKTSKGVTAGVNKAVHYYSTYVKEA